MNVNIIQEWNNPTAEEKFKKTSKENPFFYIVVLQMGRVRFLKIGTAENSLRGRFSQADYKKYSSIKILYAAELESDKKNKKNVCYHVEDLTRSAIREMKGFTFVKNDRFKFFQLPDQLPVFTGMNNYTLVNLH